MFKILFIGRDICDPYTMKAISYLRRFKSELICEFSEYGQKFPEQLRYWTGDYLISYCCRWIIPERVLKNVRTSINFHPAPPEYPGIGAANFALYDNSDSYGVTCHHMKKEFDTGPIIRVIRFPIYEEDNVETLLTRAHDNQIVLFYEIMDMVFKGINLPLSSEKWSENIHTREELNSLGVLDFKMSIDEIKRRIRASNYKKWKPFMRISEHIFEMIGEKK